MTIPQPSTASKAHVAYTQHGGALVREPSRHWKLATVLAYHPDTYTYDVASRDGEPLTGVPRLLDSPGSAEILPRDTIVAIHDELGFWVVDRVLSIGVINRQDVTTPQISAVTGGGAQDPVYAGGGDTNSRPVNGPDDITEGDISKVGVDGNLMAILRGGTNVMKSSQMAQVRTHSINDLVEILSENFRHITCMGEMNIKNTGGKTSLSWRAGTDQTNESGSDQENWTIKLDIGDVGDLFNFEVTTPTGQTLSKIHMSAEGELELFGAAGVLITSGDNGVHSDVTAGDKHTEVLGDLTEEFSGLVNTTTGTRTTTVKGSDQLSISQTLQETVGGDHDVFTGGVHQEKIMGGTTPLPGNKASLVEYINGTAQTVLGNPASGGIPLQQMQQWVNYAGGYTFVVQPTAAPFPLGGFAVMSPLPFSVHLGVDGTAIPDPVNGGHVIVPVPGPFGVMKYEPFLAMMEAMLLLLDSHVHTATGPAAPTTPPVVPFTPTIQGLLSTIRSMRVSVGL